MTRKPLPEIPHVEPEPGERSFTCRSCKKLWPYRREFTRGNDGNHCLNCTRAERRSHSSQSHSRKTHLKYTYGLTVEEFNRKLRRQGLRMRDLR